MAAVSGPAPISARAAELRERLVVTLISLGAFFALWWALAEFGHMPHSMFAPPGDVFGVLGQLITSGQLFVHIGTTGLTFVLGYALSAVVGIALGLILGVRPDIEAVVGPYLMALYAAPRVAFVSLLVVWFGFGLTTSVILVFLGAVFPIVLNTMTGAQLVSPVYLKVARSFRANRSETFVEVILPFSVPYIFTGLQLAVGRGLIGAIVGEFFGGHAGLGVYVMQAGFQFDPARVLAGALTLAIISVVLSELPRVVGQRVAPWQVESRL